MDTAAMREDLRDSDFLGVRDLREEFVESRSKNWSSLALSSVWAYPAVDASVSKIGNNILIFIKAFLLPQYGSKSGYRIFSWGRRRCGCEDGMSDVSEQRRKEDHHYRRPRAVDRQVIRLPFFEGGERSAPSQEAEVERGGPRQIDQENHVLAQGGHAVRGKAELGDARGDGPQRDRVDQEGADHQRDLHHVEDAGR